MAKVTLRLGVSNHRIRRFYVSTSSEMYFGTIDETIERLNALPERKIFLNRDALKLLNLRGRWHDAVGPKDEVVKALTALKLKVMFQ